MSSMSSTWRVETAVSGARLDRALSEKLGLPRNQVERWIDAGRVRVNGRTVAKRGAKLAAGAEVSWEPPPPAEEILVPEAGELRLLYADESLLVIDKPAGLVVHPGAGRSGGTLVHRLLDRFPELSGVGGPGRPGIVHRLDRGTSGLLLVARTKPAYAALTKAFAAREVDKRYLAIVHGKPRAGAGAIDRPIGRHPTERKRMAVVARGRPARTGWRLLASARSHSLLELELFTGRTHQIRVHLKHANLPLVGDPVYGVTKKETKLATRPALHAWRLALRHPESGEPLHFEAPFPADLRTLWRELSGGELPAEIQKRRDENFD
jgi:23S rRNA pseudouridine1911/1915/1917 synthase